MLDYDVRGVSLEVAHRTCSKQAARIFSAKEMLQRMYMGILILGW